MSEIVTMLSTVILTAITGYYVYLTHSMLVEMKSSNHRQTFETGFFQLISFHHQLIDRMDLTAFPTYENGESLPEQELVGSDCFVELLKRFQKIRQEHGLNSDDPPSEYRKAYNDFYQRHQSDLGHYFRNLYNIVKFVKFNDEIKDKRLYTNIIRAQLSSHELLLLFYNCTVGLGEKKFKDFVEEYALLNNMPPDKLIDESHRDWIDASAFG